MTYKSSSENLNHINRVASASTRPHATGRIDDLPPWAKEPEEYFNSLKKRHDLLQEQLYKLREEVAFTKKRLKQLLPHSEFVRLRDRLDIIGPQFTALEREAADHKSLTRAAAINAFGTVFYYAAQRILDWEVRKKIDIEVQELLARTPSADIEKPWGEDRSEGYKTRSYRQNKFKRKLTLQRDKRGQADQVVWSDEKGGIVSRKVLDRK